MQWRNLILTLSYVQSAYPLDFKYLYKHKSAEETLEVYVKLRDFGICKNESMRKSIHLIQSLSWTSKELMCTKQE